MQDGKSYLKTASGEIPIKLFGAHNMQNISGAMEVCKLIGVTEEQFYSVIGSFQGANMRLELVAENNHFRLYKDFAHAPSKLLATTKAVKEQFPDRQLIACGELHTYSSLNPEFIGQYQDTLQDADVGIVYHNPEVSQHKKLTPLTDEQLKKAFNQEDILIFTRSQDLQKYLTDQQWENKNLLMMSSGTFGGLDLVVLGEKITGNG